MSNWAGKTKHIEACGVFTTESGFALRVRIEPGTLAVVSAAEAASWLAERSIPGAAGAKGLLLLGPEAYSFGLVPPPLSTSAMTESQTRDALRWAFAKDAELDMSQAEWETQFVPGVAAGGALLKESHWVYAIERRKLLSLVEPLIKLRLRIEAVDALATAQRNLCWAEVRGASERAGAYASLVVGASYSALGIVSLDGDLLFHKQMEWTATSLKSPDARERLVVELQRNLGYFERRLSSFAVIEGRVFGIEADGLAADLSQSLGGFMWRPAEYPGVAWGGGLSSAGLSGDWAWLLGSLWRWG